MVPAVRDFDFRMARVTQGAVAAFALAALAPMAHAGILYKSISANGVVQFSDTPPAEGVVVEQRPTGIDSPPVIAALAGPAVLTGPASNPLLALVDGNADDEALARANAQVDMAEHALALARRGEGVGTSRFRLAEAARTASDDERIAFYEHDLELARANLLAMLKERRAQASVPPEPGAPILGPLRRIASR
jgi:hypothetical protein